MRVLRACAPLLLLVARAYACGAGTYAQAGTCVDEIGGETCDEVYYSGICDHYCVECCNTCAAMSQQCPPPISCVSCPANSGASCTACTAQSQCACNPGYYGPNGGPCTSCPASSTSPSGSTTVASCICNPGYSGPNGGVCTACVAGKYKDTTGSVVCTTCPTDSNSPSTSIALTACTCNLGFTGLDGGTCTACAVGKYKAATGSADCTTCPSGTSTWEPGNYPTTLSGSTAVTACACNAGYYGSNGGPTCTQCAAGKFTPSSGGSACVPCGTQATGPVGSTSSSNCVCNAGYFRSNGACTQCVAGKFSVAAQTACTDCAAGKYSATVGATTEANCLACAAGKYSATVGATIEANCLACPASTTSVDGSSSSTACISTDCSAGYTGPAGSCTACAVGKYKPTTGSAACTDCPAATYQSSTGSSVCTACPTNSGSTCTRCTASNKCLCNLGYTGPSGGVCTACATGKYKPYTGSAVCTDCATATYLTTTGATALATCVACPSNSISPLASTTLTACKCNVGFTGSDGPGPCTACGAGAYKSNSGSSVCSTCPTNTGASCTSCYTSACPCNAGYVGGNFISQYSTTACARFVALMVWKPSFASVSTRLNAAVGTLPTYNPTGGPNGKGHVSFDRTLSQYLSTGSRTYNIATNGGFTVVIVLRFTGTASDYETLFELANDAFFENGIKIYRQSPNNEIQFSIWNGVWTPSSKVADATTTGGMLVQNSWLTVVCRYRAFSNTFILSVNDLSFAAYVTAAVTDRTVLNTVIGKSLGGDAYSNHDVAGLFFVDEYLYTDATAAIVNAIVNGVDMTDTTCPIGNTCISAACNIGYTGPAGACTACVAGKYKTATGSADCTDCAAGTYSATTGATAAATCVACLASNSGATCSGCSALAGCTCNAGYTGIDGGVSCDNCYPGQYKSVPGSAACTDCAAGTYSDIYGSQTCIPCPAGQYGIATGGVNIFACTSCTYAKYLPTTGSTTEAACISCAAGYQGVLKAQSSIASCTLCVAGKYSALPATPTCTKCPAGTASSVIGSTSLLNCVSCPAGTWANGLAATTCTLCDQGKYSVTVAASSSSTCLLCPTNPDQSIKGSSTCYVPACAAGYTGPDGGVCSPCDAGTYKDATGSAACTHCTAGTYSATAAATSAATCLACPAGTYSATAGATAAATCAACAPDTYSGAGAAACASCAPALPNPQRCTNRAQNMSACPILNGLWTNASAAEVAAFDAATDRSLTSIYTAITAQNEVSNATACGRQPPSRFTDFYCQYYGGSDTIFAPCFAEGQSLKPCYEQCARFESCLFTVTTQMSTAICAQISPAAGAACLGPSTVSLPKTSNAARDGCVCRPGNTNTGGVCVACAPGTYKTDAGDGACAACGAGSFSLAGSLGPDACVCAAGFRPS